MSLSKPCNFSFYPDSLDYYSIYTTIFIPCYHHFCHIIMVCLPPFIASCYPDSLDCSLYHPLYIYTYIYITCMYIYIYIHPILPPFLAANSAPKIGAFSQHPRHPRHPRHQAALGIHEDQIHVLRSQELLWRQWDKMGI